ncbi:MAG: hypothetical protein FWG83_02580 [Oscillospiraceae bacterium]|nr:hypothetical protein [Oscillospiraceae bacterium]
MILYKGSQTMQSSTAVLDLDLFDDEERQKRKKSSPFKSKRAREIQEENPNNAVARRGSPFAWVILGAFALGAIVFFVNSKIEMSDINRQTAVVEAGLEEARKENERLGAQLVGMAGPEKIEEYAAGAGLVRAHDSQTIYITVNSDKLVEVAEESEGDWLTYVDRFFDKALEFLGFR